MLKQLAELTHKAIESKLKQNRITHDDSMAILKLILAYEKCTRTNATVPSNEVVDFEEVIVTDDAEEDIVQESQNKLADDMAEAMNFDLLYEAVENPKEGE